MTMTKEEFADDKGITVLTYGDLEKQYEDMLDELYGDVQICGSSYSSSNALKELDPTAFRCGLSDWLSEDYEEFNDGYILKSDLEDLESDYEEYLEELETENE